MPLAGPVRPLRDTIPQAFTPAALKSAKDPVRDGLTHRPAGHFQSRTRQQPPPITQPSRSTGPWPACLRVVLMCSLRAGQIGGRIPVLRLADTGTRDQGQQHRTQAGCNDRGDAPTYIRLKPLLPPMYAGQGPVLRVIMRLGPRPLTDAERLCLATITTAGLPCMIAPSPELAPNHRPSQTHHGAPGLGPRAAAWRSCFRRIPAWASA